MDRLKDSYFFNFWTVGFRLKKIRNKTFLNKIFLQTFCQVKDWQNVLFLAVQERFHQVKHFILQKFYT